MWLTQDSPLKHASWPAMMKTWIGPSWTGSVEFATPMQVSVSSAIALLPGTMPRHLLWVERRLATRVADRTGVLWQRVAGIELGSTGVLIKLRKRPAKDEYYLTPA